MLSYRYVARDPNTGEKIKADVQADNEHAAAKLVKAQGLILLDLKSEGEASNAFTRYLNRVKTKEKILFSRQLSTLINAGLPLLQSLRSVAKQTKTKPLQRVINQIISDIEAGSSLSEAMRKHPKVFNNIYISLIASGETSGKLDESLERIAFQQEKDAEIMSKVKGAMIYPLVVVMVMLVVVGFMIVQVLPQVEVLYADLPGASLPLITRILLGISHFITEKWWLFLIMVGLAVFFTTKWARTGAGKELIDKLKMRAWPIGPLFMKLYMARFARTGTTLVGSGVPLIQVLEITAQSVSNIHIERSVYKAIEKVKGGTALSEAIKDDPNFLPLVPDMLSIGEQSGAIEAMMGKIAEYYEKEVDTQIRTISTIIEPVLMVLLGVMAFIIVAAVLLPIYGLAGQTIIR
jgi:type IV pilus assembly protein PilC